MQNGGSIMRLHDMVTGRNGIAVRCLVVLVSLALQASPAPRAGSEPAISEKDFEQIQGDYKVAVYPAPFGFMAHDGKLFLKVGGLKGSGEEVPLIQQEDGKFVVRPGHPNAFQFALAGTRVKFTFWSVGQAFEGVRLGDPAADQAGAGKTSAAPAIPGPNEKSRSAIQAELQEVQQRLEKTPSDEQTRLACARLLYQSGEFVRARGEIRHVVKTANPPADALALAADLEYLTGGYAEAERLYQQVASARGDDLTGRVAAMKGQLLTYYQRNQFGRARELEFPAGAVLPRADVMRSFDKDAYQVEWAGKERITSVPFLTTDPLPLMTIEFNGVPVSVIFDTGADMFILDDEIASGLGIGRIASATGTFGGGLSAQTSFGKVDRVKLGEVTLKQVPIMILPTKKYSSAFEGGKLIIGGFIGTAALRQFLSTIDYAKGRLVLRERSADAARGLRDQLAGRIAGEVPFVLYGTHMMMVRGRLNDKDGLTFFVDSGLASDASVTAPIQTLKHLGLAEPEQQAPDGSIVGGGGGGGVWASGSFDLETVALGSLTQSRLKGEYGARPPESYWQCGFIVDALISHRFLRQYASWTLDFDTMTYLFER